MPVNCVAVRPATCVGDNAAISSVVRLLSAVVVSAPIWVAVNEASWAAESSSNVVDVRLAIWVGVSMDTVSDCARSDVSEASCVDDSPRAWVVDSAPI